MRLLFDEESVYDNKYMNNISYVNILTPTVGNMSVMECFCFPFCFHVFVHRPGRKLGLTVKPVALWYLLVLMISRGKP